MKDQQTKERFMELRAQGWSFARIAKELKVSKQSLISWSRELALQIANLKAIELEALQEKYLLLKRQRMEFFGEKLKAIAEELARRNLKDVPIDKLFDLLAKYESLITKESGDIVFQEEKDSLATLGANLTEVKSWKA